MIFNGVQIIWTKNVKSPTAGIIGIEIVKDRRDKTCPDYPYALHVGGHYEGHYQKLNQAKQEGVKHCG